MRVGKFGNELAEFLEARQPGWRQAEGGVDPGPGAPP